MEPTTDLDKMRIAAEQLKTHLHTLLDLSIRLATVRQHPALLRQVAGAPSTNDPSSGGGISMTVSEPQLALSSLRLAFQDLSALRRDARGEGVQAALKAARESEKADPAGLGMRIRRESRKRRRAPSPTSPEPFMSSALNSQPSPDLPFPISPDAPPPLRADALIPFLRAHNASSPSKLAIWAPTRRRPPPKSGSEPTAMNIDVLPDNPVTVRLRIPDVLTAFITLFAPHVESQLLVETVTVFGPREKKSPYAFSDFTVYQRVATQLSRMVRAQPRVSFQAFLEMLLSYDSLFIARCPVCERVLSAEGHVPPVARVWVKTSSGSDVGMDMDMGLAMGLGSGLEGAGAGSGEKGGAWAPRHVMCL